MKKLSILITFVVLLSIVAATNVLAATIPTITIIGVTEDEKVTIQTHNYPKSKNFEVRMGLFGTKGIDGILVGTINSGDGGSLKLTFTIPEALYSENKIAIRLDSTSGGYYSYNWFHNNTAGSHEGGVPAEDVPASPTISVVSVKKDEYAVIKGDHFPTDEEIDVLMGEYGTQGVDGILVATITADEDGSFSETFEIPESLQSECKIAIRFESQDSDMVVYSWFENVTGAAGGCDSSDDAYSGIPTISILSVEEDESVTVKTHNFPADKEFKVLMGKMGTKGIGGIEVTTIDSEDGGVFEATFDIPEALQGDYRIAIRLESTTGGFFAYNWFYNNTSDGDGDDAPSGYTGIPTFAIVSVAEDESVTIKTHNFPADRDFKVLMGKMGTKGVGGIEVTTIDSEDGGVFEATFDIPESLQGEYRIAIRLESTTGGFFAYNWFFNNTSDGDGDDTSSDYSGIPTFSIIGVTKDESVTIKTNNFPSGRDFKVLMGKMGTKGVGGIEVTTIDSEDGGVFEQTFDIPEELQGDYRIAIRLESTTGGFYAYNWFFNTTYP
jgi:hypothetical protein